MPSSASSCCATCAQGQFECLVGVNLLREGLDLPEVSLVAILDADKEGFLRSETSLIQTIGRAARNVNAKVILYADKVTDAMRNAMDETRRRRAMQEKYNTEHGITPETIKKHIRAGIEEAVSAHRAGQRRRRPHRRSGRTSPRSTSRELEAEMYEAAKELDFEKAAALRDRIDQFRDSVGKKLSDVQVKSYKPGSKTKKHKGGSHIPRPKKRT